MTTGTPRWRWTRAPGFSTGTLWDRSHRALALVVVAALVSLTAVLSPPALAVAKEPTAEDLPGLESEPAPRSAPVAPTGDFSNPPDPSAAEDRALPLPSSFDPARSVVVDAETTPTRLVYQDPSGSNTAVINQQPVRFERDGAWVDIDTSLVAGPDETLVARAAPAGARLGTRSAGAVATIDTAAGPIVLRHAPGAPSVAATTADNTATYPDALGEGRDLALSLTGDGFEEKVVLAAAGTSGTYRDQFVLPAGVSARDVGAGAAVEFVDRDGVVIATFGGGVAYDATLAETGPHNSAPVTVRLAAATDQDPADEGAAEAADAPAAAASTPDPADTAAEGEAAEATTTTTAPATQPAPDAVPLAEGASVVDVEVAAPESWLGDKARVYPVTIDPILSFSSAGPNFDTWVNQNPTYANTALYANPWLVVGSFDGAYRNRSDLLFDVTSVPTGPNVDVVSASLTMWNWYALGCSARTLNVWGLSGSPNISTTSTWNNQPPLDTNSGASATTAAAYGAAGCAANYQSLDATALANRWVHDGAANWGMAVLAGNELDTASYRGYYSAEGASANFKTPPTLSITYNRRPSMAVADGPTDGTTIVTPIPTLRVLLATDADTTPPAPVPDPVVQYWFRISNIDGVEGGHAVDSGWQNSQNTTNPHQWAVPLGSLHDGTYYWHVFTWDGVNAARFTSPTWDQMFRVNLRLGSGGPAPVDAIGPARVNLASGNVALGHASPAFNAVGGPLGVSFAYNSQGATSGLVGNFYNGLSGTPPVVPTTAPTLVRTDPSVAYYWGSGHAPGPGVGATDFTARWSGYLSAPAGRYKLFVGTTDRVRVKVDGTQILEQWVTETTNNVTVVATSDTTFDATHLSRPIIVEYAQGTGPANVTLAAQLLNANGTNQLNGDGSIKTVIVPPSWLAADTAPLPQGWTFSGSGSPAYASARTLDDGSVVVSDVSGGGHSYPASGTGFQSPLGAEAVLAKTSAAGAVTLHDGDGMTYAFAANGGLETATSTVDNEDSAALIYGWSATLGHPERLHTVTDPVSGQDIVLRYGDEADCPTGPPAGMQGATGALLCSATYSWDGTVTELWYSGGRLTRIEDPGASVTDFGYNASGLNSVRDSLAADAVAAGQADGDSSSATVIEYTDGGLVERVILPTAASGPAHWYEFLAEGHTKVHVVGVTGTDEPTGYYRLAVSDDAGRSLTDRDATGVKVSDITWFPDIDRPDIDRPKASVDSADRTTRYSYDPQGLPTHTYGPAPEICLDDDTGCEPVPHTLAAYDQDGDGDAITGLAATYWPNSTLSKAPTKHDTIASVGPTVVDPDLAGDAWSARLMGDIDLTVAANLQVTGNAAAKLWVDGRPAADGDAIAAGAHRVAVEIAVTSGDAALSLNSRAATTPPGGTFVAVDGSDLHPHYPLVTTTTVTDAGVASPSSVTAVAYLDHANGQATTVTQDPGGADLVTTADFETGGLQRLTSKTLPTGAATVYAYYGHTEAGANVCGQSGVNQAGRAKTVADPDPDGTGSQVARQRQVIYDVAGRVAGTKVTAPVISPVEDWACTAYDSRGRPTSSTVPAFGGQAARTTTFNWAVSANPLVTSVSDAAGTITTVVDLLGRIVSYTDAKGNVTTRTYEALTGRPAGTAGPGVGMSTAMSYDDAGRPEVQTVDTVAVATATYDPATGELATTDGVTYGNLTRLAAIGRDDSGATTALGWANLLVPLATDDVYPRSQSGRVVTQSIDGAAADSFVYDPVGRLTSADVAGVTKDYAFADSAGCGSATTAGLNTNRTSLTVGGGSPVTYCYDHADRLTSSSDTTVGTPAYDNHGNTTTMGTQTMAYDGANRHMRTQDGSNPAVVYERDATGRIVTRTVGTTVVTYGYSGPGDSPSITSYGGLSAQRDFGLIGGVLYSKSGPNGDRWSYPNIHGDVMAVADSLGIKQGSTFTDDAFGIPTAIPDNGPGNFDNGWLGSHQRPLEHEGAIATIEMGARPYVPSLGRFLGVDPVEGGCANSYTYVYGDPVGSSDLIGLYTCDGKWRRDGPNENYNSSPGGTTHIGPGQGGKVKTYYATYNYREYRCFFVALDGEGDFSRVEFRRVYVTDTRAWIGLNFGPITAGRSITVTTDKEYVYENDGWV